MTQIEMSEMRSLINGSTSRSLVLIDEICRGTETAKGTCIAGSIIESLDAIGCLGIVSTHLHGIFDLPLETKRTVYKAMGTDYIDGQTVPTWKLIDGICRESLAFETARREGLSEKVIDRAEELYQSYYGHSSPSTPTNPDPRHFIAKPDISLNGSRQEVMTSARKSVYRTEILCKELENAITAICQKKLTELYKTKNTSELAVNCVLVAVREQPPPSTIGTSTVYVMLRPDNKLYVGQVCSFMLFVLYYLNPPNAFNNQSMHPSQSLLPTFCVVTWNHIINCSLPTTIATLTYHFFYY